MPVAAPIVAIVVLAFTWGSDPGRATLQEGGVHLVLFGAFLFLAFNP